MLPLGWTLIRLSAALRTDCILRDGYGDGSTPHIVTTPYLVASFPFTEYAAVSTGGPTVLQSIHAFSFSMQFSEKQVKVTDCTDGTQWGSWKRKHIAELCHISANGSTFDQ